MIRKDTYCIYKGIEYRCVNKANDTYEIITDNKDNIDDTFTYYMDDIYYKGVNLNEIDEVYSINSFAVYNGDVFEVMREIGDEVELITNDELLAYENKMMRWDKYLYNKIVPKSEVYIFEEKNEIKM